MSARLTMVCSAVSETVRRGAFPGGGPDGVPLAASSLVAISALGRLVGRAERVWISPCLMACRTAEVLGLQGEVMAGLSDQRYGAWAGRGFADVERSEPQAMAAWLRDPEMVPPGGESFTDVFSRVAGFMETAARAPGHTLALTHAPVVRAAILHVIGAPLSGLRHIDVVPLSLTDFRSDGRRWVLRATGVTPSRRGHAAGIEQGG